MLHFTYMQIHNKTNIDISRVSTVFRVGADTFDDIKMKACIIHDVLYCTLESYRTLALVGSGSQQRTRSPSLNLQRNPRVDTIIGVLNFDRCRSQVPLRHSLLPYPSHNKSTSQLQYKYRHRYPIGVPAELYLCFIRSNWLSKGQNICY